jgi:NADH dehydrogenase
MQRPRVVILGGGFAGLATARGLRRAPVDVVLVDRANHHAFQPLLYQVATAGLSAPQIAAPIRYILRHQRNCRVLLGEVTAVDVDARRVALSEGLQLDYDYLVVATGVTHSYFGHDEWAQYAPGLKTMEDALAIRRRILLAFECAELETDATARAEWLNFVIVGGGPTGVELAGTLAEIARHTLASEFRSFDPASARIVLVEAGARVLATYPESLSARALDELRGLGVEVRLGAPVAHIDAHGVQVGAERIAARTVLWSAGVQTTALARQLPGDRDRQGRLHVSRALHLPSHPEVLVVGDLAHVEQNGGVVPAVAQPAKQMGAHAARCIARLAAGAAPATLPAFRYRDYGSMATIGRNAAIAEFPGGMKLWGWPAWIAWLFIHIFFLIGFRNRVLVLTDWATSYWTYQRHARLIIR